MQKGLAFRVMDPNAIPSEGTGKKTQRRKWAMFVASRGLAKGTLGQVNELREDHQEDSIKRA